MPKTTRKPADTPVTSNDKPAPKSTKATRPTTNLRWFKENHTVQQLVDDTPFISLLGKPEEHVYGLVTGRLGTKATVDYAYAKFFGEAERAAVRAVFAATKPAKEDKAAINAAIASTAQKPARKARMTVTGTANHGEAHPTDSPAAEKRALRAAARREAKGEAAPAPIPGAVVVKRRKPTADGPSEAQVIATAVAEAIEAATEATEELAAEAVA